MSEADVVYADVRFTARKQNSKEAPSSTDDTTYSGVKISGARPPAELPVSQPEAAGGRSKVTVKWLLLLLCCLLVAAVVALCLLSLDNIKAKTNLQTLQDENDALRKNLTAEPGPTCDSGWEQRGGRCYYFSTDKLNWTQSRSDCKGRGADLVLIDSEEEQWFLTFRLRGKMKDFEDKFWIGLTDSKEEGKWLWVDDSPLDTSLSFWYDKEPDNFKQHDPAGEDCARMGIDRATTQLWCWFDRSCAASNRRICEKAAKTG